MKRMAMALLAALLGIGLMVGAAPAASAAPAPKVGVCKYVGKPGAGETLQTFIEVAGSTLKGWDGETFPFEFADAQGRSVAIGFADEVSKGDCPKADYGPVFDGWVTWEIPDGGTSSNIKYPQKFVGLGMIGASKCGVTNQHDYYVGPKALVEEMWADGLLQHKEDWPYVKKWFFTYGGDCEPGPEPRKVTRTYQVDTYLNPTSKLARRAAGYDNNGKLMWGEDRPHYGHSYYQIVKVKGTTAWTKAQWVKAINKATTRRGVGSVKYFSHASKVSKGEKLTVAWRVRGPWRSNPQTFFARS